MKIIIVLFCLGLIGCATVSKENRISATKTSGNTQYIALDQKELDNIISIFSEAIKNKPGYAGSYYNRAIAYFYKNDYDKSWRDIHKAEALGIKADQNFTKLINKLKKASGREK
ncbi:MAG: hypothetical protein WC616_00010 [Candidatus Omnitrophota bacterium]